MNEKFAIKQNPNKTNWIGDFTDAQKTGNEQVWYCVANRTYFPAQAEGDGWLEYITAEHAVATVSAPSPADRREDPENIGA